MQEALGRVRGFNIVFLKQGTPNIVWSNCRRILLFSIKKMVPISIHQWASVAFVSVQSMCTVVFTWVLFSCDSRHGSSE